MDNQMRENYTDKRLLIPVLLGFFVSGYSDIVAPLTGNIIVKDFADNADALDRISFLPSMAFLWFLFLAIPIAAFMNRRGRKIAAQIGCVSSFLGLMIAFWAAGAHSLIGYFVGFGLLGLGNTFVQMAVNPLLAAIVPQNRMTSYLTVGQIWRNVSLLLVGPLALGCAVWLGEWQLALVAYALVTVVGWVWLLRIRFPEADPHEKPAGLADCVRLMGNRTVLISALGIGSFIMADVGINFVGGQLIGTSSSILGSTGFYISRIIGTVIGYFLLRKISDVKYLRWNMAVAFALCFAMLFMQQQSLLYLAMGLMGFLISCVFATFFAAATKAVAERDGNGVAGLMILSISAGAVACPVCGWLIGALGDTSMGLLLPLAAVGYMFWASWKLNVE